MKLRPSTVRELQHIGDEFLVAVLREETDRRDNLAAMFELGAVLTRLGRHQEGLEIDRRLVSLEPEEPILRYNLACSLALVGQPEESLDELSRAVDLGYDDLKHMVADRDLETLRGLERYDELVRRIKEGAKDRADQD